MSLCCWHPPGQVGVVRELTLLVGVWPVVGGGFVLAVLIDWNVISGIVSARTVTLQYPAGAAAGAAAAASSSCPQPHLHERPELII